MKSFEALIFGLARSRLRPNQLFTPSERETKVQLWVNFALSERNIP